MIKIKMIQGINISNFTFEKPAIISDIINKTTEFHLDHPCVASGTCGKCKVKVFGEISPITVEEKTFLNEKEISEGVRLACFTEIFGNSEIYLPYRETKVVSEIRMKEMELTGKGHGIAVDVGTTTIAMHLYDLSSGLLLSEVTKLNLQGSHGADVISRIQYAINNYDDDLHNIIKRQLSDMAIECMEKAGINRIEEAVVTGHTAMLHFYENLSVDGIAKAPFVPTSLFGIKSKTKLLNANTYLPSSISSYIGSDIMCSIVAAGMDEKLNEVQLLADLGTNGELVLCYGGNFYCASTAAGPAFEGSNIKWGMASGDGAISKLRFDGRNIIVETIGKKKAVGICGSGIVDAVSIMIQLEIIDETGKFDKEYSGYGNILDDDGDIAWNIPGTEVFITQKDIRQIQLAKAAICAGIETMFEEIGISFEMLDTFYIAGGFGYYMDVSNGRKIGLFPRELESRIEIIGNGSLSGAVELLLDPSRREREKNIFLRSKEIVLSGNKKFSEYYIENMIFEYE